MNPGTDPHTLLDGLADALREWLPEQRWFAGKDRPVHAVTAVRATTLLDSSPKLVHAVVAVEQDGRSADYQLLVGVRDEPAEHLGHSWIGRVGGSECFDATQDPELAGHLLDLLAAQEPVGGVDFRQEPDAELTTGLRARPVGAQQSNTSVVFGHQYILKLFRRLATGPNPDLVLHHALHVLGCQHIAQPLGSITGELRGEPVVFGVLHQFLPDAVEGWAMATTSVRDLMAEADLHADEVGGDFASEAHRLGQAVATVHADLARALGTQLAGPDRLADAVEGMHSRLDAVLRVVPALAASEKALRTAFDAARSTDARVPVQHVHGDLHLGQVLRTVTGWVLIDFEGEPAAPAAERTALRSPLRDVAGVLRSFDYAAHQMLVGQPEDHQLTVRALEWTQRNGRAFCQGYAEVAADPREQAALLRAMELDKAVYEVAYEHSNRPDWLPIPLASIRRITSAEEPT